MKVIAVDNFDRDCVNDELVAANVHEFYAKQIAKAMNGMFGGEDAVRYYKAVKDDYKVKVYEP